MTPSRRTVLAGGATGLVALSAGCLDFVLGDGPLEFEASRAAPTDSALEETDFEEFNISEENIEETVGAGIERDVNASYWVSVYTREIEIGDESEEGAGFVAVSTPDASVAGKSFNPIADMDNDEIIDEVGDELGDQNVENIEHESSTSLEILGDEREVDVFVGEREYEGEPIEVELLVSSFEHEDDYLVILGMYPRIDSLREAVIAVHGDDEDADDDTEEAVEEELPEDIPEDVETLFEEVEHPL